jgi:hypothetical protein
MRAILSPPLRAELDEPARSVASRLPLFLQLFSALVDGGAHREMEAMVGVLGALGGALPPSHLHSLAGLVLAAGEDGKLAVSFWLLERVWFC